MIGEHRLRHSLPAKTQFPISATGRHTTSHLFKMGCTGGLSQLRLAWRCSAHSRSSLRRRYAGTTRSEHDWAKSLQATRDGTFSSASRFTSFGPARMDYAPLIVWLTTILVTLLLHLKYSIPLWRASRRLEEATRQLDPTSFVGGTCWRVQMAIQMLTNPKGIFVDSDTTEFHALKHED